MPGCAGPGPSSSRGEPSFSKARSRRRRGPRSKRCQPRGASGHGRTLGLPDSRRRLSGMTRPASERVCPCCGEPSPRGATAMQASVCPSRSTSRPDTRKIVRGHWRRGCPCPLSPSGDDGTACYAAVPSDTLRATPVWVRVLYDRLRLFEKPRRRVSRWMAEQGLPMAPGTMAGAMNSLALDVRTPEFPAILDHHNDMTVRHGDETSWERQANCAESSRFESRREDGVTNHFHPEFMGRALGEDARSSVDRGAYGRGRFHLRNV